MRGVMEGLAEEGRPAVECQSDDYLTDLVLRLAHFFASEDYEDGKSSSTLVYFSGVLGISADGTTFKWALNYTLSYQQ